MTNQGMSNLTAQQLALLVQPINPLRVSRNQGGFSYVEAWDIKAMLIRAFGFGGFSCEVLEESIIDIREGERAGTKRDGTPKNPNVIAKARLRLTVFGIGPAGENAVYTESAVGSAFNPDIGDACDQAVKTAASQALKRCAINLGTQFGLSLYQKGSTDDVVKVMFCEWQREMIAAGYEAPVPQQPSRQPNSDVQAALNRATQEQVAPDAEYADAPTGDYS